MEQRRNLEKNLENVYLSPQSVSSRIKSINEEIKNNINKNREEMKCNKVKDEVRSIKSQGSISVDNRISIGNRIKIDLLEKKNEIVKEDFKEDQREIIKDSKVRDLVKNYSKRLNQKGNVREGSVKEEGNVQKEESVKGGSDNPFIKNHNNIPCNGPFITNPLVKDNNPFKTPLNQERLSPFKTPLNQERLNPFITNPLIKKDNPFNKNLYSSSNNPLSNNNPLSVLSLNEHSFPSKPFPSLSLTPINVIYAPKNPPTLEKKLDLPSPKKSFNKTLSSSFSFYGPGIEITEDINFSILNTIYKFENGIEDTIYYFKINNFNNNNNDINNNFINFNPISWIIKKSLSQIRDFLKNSSLKKDLDFSFNPYDKKIRDNVIITILNTLGKNKDKDYDKDKGDYNSKGDHYNIDNNNNINNSINNNLQFFILTNITKHLDLRSNYLLMSNPPILEPFNFRLVGQALVCYDKTNRVKKIFLLKGCKVEIHSEYSFKISSLESNVILYCSCTVERDSWIKDIEEFIK